jgi:signal transduction histidine kinase
MSLVLKALEYAVSVAFITLGVLTVRDWLSGRDKRRGYLALALGLLGLVSLLGRIQELEGYRTRILTVLSLVGFIGSGYALLMFRHSFIPLSRAARLIAAVGLAAAGILVLWVAPPQDPAVAPTRVQALATMVFLVAWVACVAEPSARFWLASRHLPAVQRRRLQAISLGYFGIALILLVAGGAGLQNQYVTLAIQLGGVLVAPLLYASFAPPRWLRRIWREPEEERFRAAINDLLLFAPGRRPLAERAIDWACRLVGADSGLVVDGDGELLAVHNINEEKAARIAAGVLARVPTEGEVQESTISVPLHLDNGMGRLIVVAGPYTPLFGTDEEARLHQYSVAMAAALDRVRVAERMTALEEVKSRFLRLASHELRGPLTLVRGYVSMIGEGSLSDEGIQRAVPLMLAKLSQMTGMLNEMLETARIEDNALQVKAEKFDLRDAVTDVVAMIRPITGNGHHLEATMPSQEISVVADRAKIETILSNLVDNAIKYSPGGGEVLLELATTDDSAMLTVSDQGIGIEEGDMKVLFTRFGRISNDDTIPIAGTGLGLYLSRELARVQAGDVTVESKHGHGSRFTLSLPLAKA